MQDESTEEAKRCTALIAMELASYRIDLATLSETRLLDQEKLREAVAGYTFYWIGHPTGSAREHSVGFAVADRLTSRLLDETLGICPRDVNAARSWAWQSRNDFQCIRTEQLSASIRITPATDCLIDMGDFNALAGRDGTHGLEHLETPGFKQLMKRLFVYFICASCTR